MNATARVCGGKRVLISYHKEPQQEEDARENMGAWAWGLLSEYSWEGIRRRPFHHIQNQFSVAARKEFSYVTFKVYYRVWGDEPMF
jgi:hypothetical protein